MKLVFMGTPEFAVPCLQSLSRSHQVLSVVTQPDKARGRGMTVTESPVKAASQALGLTVLQPVSVREPEFLDKLKALQPELGVVVAYGQFLTQELLDIPVKGWINVHASLLPKYRGAAPITRAIAGGEKVTGLTIQYLSLKMDSGDVILHKNMEILEQDTTETLKARLQQNAPDLLMQAVELIGQGREKREKQEESQATFAPILKKEDGLIRWDKSAREIFNLIRAMDPWPVAYSSLGQKVLRIWEAEEKPLPGKQEPGTICQVIKDQGWLVATGKGGLLVKSVQAQDGKRMNAYTYGLGHKVTENIRFA